MEMFQVFNMGIGMALIVSETAAAEVSRRARAKKIGRIERATRSPR